MGDSMMNLHNHTTFSDGAFTCEEIISAAIEADLDTVAITDHFMTRKTRSLGLDNLHEYTNLLKSLKEEHSGKIGILCGLEVDTSPDRTDLDALATAELPGVDFLLFEYVQDSVWGGLPLWEAVNYRKNFDCHVGLAHTDIGKVFAHIPTDELIGMLEASEIFIELTTGSRNTKFGKPYYHFAPDFFEAIRGRAVSLSVGTDTHSSLQEVGGVEDAFAFIEKQELSDNLILASNWIKTT